MKTIYLIISLLFIQLSSPAQWCVPTTVLPYNANMPGITHVVLNNIDRTSSDLENYPSNSYVNTNLSTQLIKGNTYTMNISYTIDASICPDMNLRVWIDYNQDGQLDDMGETVISANNQAPGTYTGSFTIPSSAVSGNTRMRVTAKMSPNGGHTMPTPCDNPPDPFGYHGEIEDYDIVIMDAVGINTIEKESAFQVKSLNDIITIKIPSNNFKTADILDISGRHIKQFFLSPINNHETAFDCSELKSGNYMIMFRNGESITTRRFVIQ